MTQREFMIGLREKYGADKERVCLAYVRAEDQGEVGRKGRSKTPEQYADALWRDGIHKGWLKA